MDSELLANVRALAEFFGGGTLRFLVDERGLI